MGSFWLVFLRLLKQFCSVALVCIFITVVIPSDLWAFKYGDVVWSVSDFYSFFPKNEWRSVADDKKDGIITGFLKQNVAAQNALNLGLNYSEDVEKKLSARYKMLMVNEYYMRHFLGSLIPYSAISFCKQNLKREVYAKHILFSLDGVSNKDSVFVLAKTLKDSIDNGENFGLLASRYSSDPSVGVNGGDLGWVQIGKTVPVFQNALFSLCSGCVEVVETDFGVHVVSVDSSRFSSYNEMDDNLYNDYVFRFASAYIEESLKDVAAAHDTLLIRDANISFNRDAFKELVLLLDDELKRKNGKRKDVNIIEILKGFSKGLVLYDSEVLSGAWFANKIETTLHRVSFYSSVDDMINDFNMILLRDIVYKKAENLKLNENFSFNNQYTVVMLGLYEKAYLKWLTDNVAMPTKQEVETYHKENQSEQDLNLAYKSIETILLQKKQKEAKSLFEKSIEDRVNILINTEWYND